jgi:hypothetical protein
MKGLDIPLWVLMSIHFGAARQPVRDHPHHLRTRQPLGEPCQGFRKPAPLESIHQRSVPNENNGRVNRNT